MKFSVGENGRVVLELNSRTSAISCIPVAGNASHCLNTDLTISDKVCLAACHSCIYSNVFMQTRSHKGASGTLAATSSYLVPAIPCQSCSSWVSW